MSMVAVKAVSLPVSSMTGRPCRKHIEGAVGERDGNSCRIRIFRGRLVDVLFKPSRVVG